MYEAIRGATHIFLTHGHGDHVGDSTAIAKEAGLPIAGIYDLMGHLKAKAGVEIIRPDQALFSSRVAELRATARRGGGWEQRTEEERHEVPGRRRLGEAALSEAERCTDERVPPARAFSISRHYA